MRSDVAPAGLCLYSASRPRRPARSEGELAMMLPCDYCGKPLDTTSDQARWVAAGSTSAGEWWHERCWASETGPTKETPFAKFERLARALVAVPKRRKRGGKRPS